MIFMICKPTDLDKFAIIRQAVVPPQGKHLVNDHMKGSSSIPSLIEALRDMYGRSQIVIPILVQKITEPLKIDSSIPALQKFKERVLDNYRSLDSHLGNNLAKFMPHLLRPYFVGELRKEWDRLLCDKLLEPTIADLNEFINKLLRWAGTQHATNAPPTSSPSSPTVQPTSSTSPFSPSSPRMRTTPKCALCSESHWLGRCSTFMAMSVEDRNKVVREKRLCLNCFTNGDTVKGCTNKHSCRHCNQRHHSYLHRDQRSSTSTTQATNPSTPDKAMTVLSKPDSPPTPNTQPENKGNFVCTVVASLQHEGLKVKARALLDHGSGATFMSEELASTLKLKRHPQDRLFEGFSQGTVRSRFHVVASLHSNTSDFVSPPIEFSVISHRLRTTPPADRDLVAEYTAENGLTLSDPEMGGAVDILLGHEYTWDFCGKVQRINRHRYIETNFGVGVIGPVQGHVKVLTVTSTATPLAQDLSRLWELDQVPESFCLSRVDQSVVNHFHANVQSINGRISIALPIKDNAPPLGDSRKQALSRLHCNERSLTTKKKLEAFNVVLREYLTLGHAHIIPQQELLLGAPCYYMPVHGVFKDTSTTTKIRPVFDATAKTTSGYTLNDTLHVGPNLYPPLADILIKFRKHTVGISAGISKMFREILLNKEYRNLHRFLLRQPSGQILDCRMERVTFGVASSPFLATQTLRYLAQLRRDTHPKAAAAIDHDFYVDDYVSGADSVQEATQLRLELCDLLSKAGMTLRKWRSNSSDFLDRTPAELREENTFSLSLSNSPTPKALGVHWDVSTDTLSISTPTITVNADSTVTKRTILSGTAGVFDVLGLFSPAIVPARILLQDLWKLNITWDKPVPQHVRAKWVSWLQELSSITSHRIPRHMTKTIFTSLHGFSDASSVAYGAVVYIRTVQDNNLIHTALVVAKARVLPVKHTTIPKAELLGAQLLAKLLTHTGKLLNVPSQDLHAWTNSAIVLYWSSKELSQLAKDRFVANRIQVIQDLLPSTKWRHVPTTDNPADLASRGVKASDLITSTLWWSGPPWLSQPSIRWPLTKLARPKEAAAVLSISIAANMDASQDHFLNQLWSRFSSFNTLARVVA